MWAIDTLIRYPLVGKGLDPIVVVFFEHVLLAAVFLPKLLSAIPRIGELKLSDAFSFIVVGVVGSALATVAFTGAFAYLNPSLVILLQKFQPVVAILLARLVLGEQVPRPFLLWASVCLVGGVLVSAPDLQQVWELLSQNPQNLASDRAVRGYTLVLISVVGWGATTVFGKKLSLAGFETTSLMAGRFGLGFVAMAFVVPWGREMIFADPMDYARIAAMVVISGLLAMAFYYQGMKRLPAKLCSILEMFFPLMAIGVNWFILGQQLLEVQLLGGGLLILGALVLQLKKY